MKKVMGLLSLVTVLTTLSCTNQAPETKKEVIVVPAPPVEKATSVTLDKNGVKVVTKKVDVDIKK